MRPGRRTRSAQGQFRGFDPCVCDDCCRQRPERLSWRLRANKGAARRLKHGNSGRGKDAEA